jgi:hypothetical protein
MCTKNLHVDTWSCVIGHGELESGVYFDRGGRRAARFGGFFVAPQGRPAPAPCLVHCSGLQGGKEGRRRKGGANSSPRGVNAMEEPTSYFFLLSDLFFFFEKSTARGLPSQVRRVRSVSVPRDLLVQKKSAVARGVRT